MRIEKKKGHPRGKIQKQWWAAGRVKCIAGQLANLRYSCLTETGALLPVEVLDKLAETSYILLLLYANIHNTLNEKESKK